MKNTATSIVIVFILGILVTPVAGAENVEDDYLPKGVEDIIVNEIYIEGEETFSLDLENITKDMLILWTFNIGGISNISFHIEGPDGSEYAYYLSLKPGGLSSGWKEWSYGFGPTQNGTYTLCWANEESFTAHMIYDIYIIEPNLVLEYPESGRMISDLTPTIEGSFYPFVDSICVSVNEQPSRDACTHNLTEWNCSSQLSSGENVITVNGTIVNGNFSYSLQKSFTVEVNTLWLYEEGGDMKIGRGMYGILLLAFGIAVISFYIVRKN